MLFYVVLFEYGACIIGVCTFRGYLW